MELFPIINLGTLATHLKELRFDIDIARVCSRSKHYQKWTTGFETYEEWEKQTSRFARVNSFWNIKLDKLASYESPKSRHKRPSHYNDSMLISLIRIWRKKWDNFESMVGVSSTQKCNFKPDFSSLPASVVIEFLKKAHQEEAHSELYISFYFGRKKNTGLTMSNNQQNYNGETSSNSSQPDGGSKMLTQAEYLKYKQSDSKSVTMFLGQIKKC